MVYGYFETRGNGHCFLGLGPYDESKHTEYFFLFTHIMGLENYRGDGWRSHPSLSPSRNLRRPFLGSFLFSATLIGIYTAYEMFVESQPDYEQKRLMELQKQTDSAIEGARSAYSSLTSSSRITSEQKIQLTASSSHSRS